MNCIKKLSAALLATAAVCLLPIPSFAALAEAMLPQSAGNTLWTLMAAILVMFMQPGFAMLECGLVRAKNAVNIIMKNFVDFAIGSLVFFVVGFGIMFGQSSHGFIGTSLFGLSGVDSASAQGQWTLTFWFFQAVFACTAATIVSGGIAERMHFPGYMVVSLFVSALIYPVSGHWVWNSLYGGAGGWLGNLGFVDFAGSTVVHSVGGWVALAGAIVLGPRLGKYTADGKARAIQGHNLPMAALGVFILWFAWFGFNCGSTTVANTSIGYIAVNTLLAGCCGLLGALAAIWLKTGKPDPTMCFNGVLAGLVGITAGCFEVSPTGAVCIGFLSGVLVVLSVLVIDQVLRVDDPVGAVSVHGVCGFFGTVMVGLFAAPGYGEHLGLLYGGDADLLLTQIVGALSIFAWAFGCGFVLFTLLSRVIRLRVPAADEKLGLDHTEHNTDAYSGFQVFLYD